MSESEQQAIAPAKRATRRAKARQIVTARLERLEDLSISKLVPSTLTLLGLCSGATAIRFALVADWHTAVTCVVFAMIFDVLDGRAARMLGADTRFGAQLDSLADLVSFGVAPGVIMYTWSLSRMGTPGWIAAIATCEDRPPVPLTVLLPRTAAGEARLHELLERIRALTGHPLPLA